MGGLSLDLDVLIWRMGTEAPALPLPKELGLVSAVRGSEAPSGSGSPVGRAPRAHVGQDERATPVAVFVGPSWMEFGKRQNVTYPCLS